MKFNYPVALISINNTIFPIHYKQCVSFSFAHNSLVLYMKITVHPHFFIKTFYLNAIFPRSSTSIELK